MSNVSVSTDIYTLWTEAGATDTSIETDLLQKGVEDGFPQLVVVLESGKQPSYWGWRRLSRFMAAQLARTPRVLRLHNDLCSHSGVESGRNDAQLAMTYMLPKLENWICQQRWFILTNATECPFVTSDNPVTNWVDRGEGAEVGVGFADPGFRLFLPITPRLGIAAVQTSEALSAILNDSADGSFTREYDLSIESAQLALIDVLRHNQVTLANAERYAYANTKDQRLHEFVKEQFTNRSAPVRRFDLRPIGSPVSGKG